MDAAPSPLLIVCDADSLGSLVHFTGAITLAWLLKPLLPP
jgi:hypothetical protein